MFYICYVHVNSDFFVHLHLDGAGCIATEQSGVRLSAVEKGFALLQNVQTDSGAHHPAVQ